MIKKEASIFIIVGLLTVAIDFLVYRCLVWGLEFDINLAKAEGFLAGTVFSYFANKYWTFRHKEHKQGSLWRFAPLYGLTLVVNIYVNSLVLAVLSNSEKATLVAFISATGLSAFLNFIGMKYFVFRAENKGPLMKVGVKASRVGIIYDIEILRAIAILFVVYGHLAALFPWVGGNEIYHYMVEHFAFWGGVDLFLVISGFVIMRTLSAQLAVDMTKGDFWKVIISFWVRRVFRIFPSAWLWLIIIPICSVIFNQTGDFKTFWPNFADMVAGMLNIANFHHYQQMQGTVAWGANSVYWSLSLEEQFYLLLPLLIFVTKKYLPYSLVLLILIQVFIPREQGSLMWEMRFDGLLLGVLLARISTMPIYSLIEPTILQDKKVARIFLVFMLIMLASIASPLLKIVPFYTGVLAILAVILVWVASYDRSYISLPRLLKPIFLWIGSRSFTIYLIHTPCFHATREIWYRFSPEKYPFDSAYTWLFGLTATFLITVIAELNYRYLEVPVREYGKRVAWKIKSSSKEAF